MPLKCIEHTKDPLVLFVNGDGELSISDVEQFTLFFNKYLTGSEQFKVLFDLRKLKTAPRPAMAKMAGYIGDFERLAIGKVQASSVIVGNKMIESLLKLLFNFNPPTTPTKITSDISEGCLFLDNY